VNKRDEGRVFRGGRISSQETMVHTPHKKVNSKANLKAKIHKEKTRLIREVFKEIRRGTGRPSGIQKKKGGNGGESKIGKKA